MPFESVELIFLSKYNRDVFSPRRGEVDVAWVNEALLLHDRPDSWWQGLKTGLVCFPASRIMEPGFCSPCKFIPISCQQRIRSGKPPKLYLLLLVVACLNRLSEKSTAACRFILPTHSTKHPWIQHCRRIMIMLSIRFLMNELYLLRWECEPKSYCVTMERNGSDLRGAGFSQYYHLFITNISTFFYLKSLTHTI